MNDLVTFITNQMAGYGDALSTPLSCSTESCIRITSKIALMCAMYVYVLER